jgi:hypothetical protein
MGDLISFRWPNRRGSLDSGVLVCWRLSMTKRGHLQLYYGMELKLRHVGLHTSVNRGNHMSVGMSQGCLHLTAPLRKQ